jgi:hypothetical protein
VNFGMRAGQKRWFKIVLAIFLVIFFLGARHPMIIDTAYPNPNLPPLEVRTYALGRFMLPVPKGMQISGTIFKINA